MDSQEYLEKIRISVEEHLYAIDTGISTKQIVSNEVTDTYLEKLWDDLDSEDDSIVIMSLFYCDAYVSESKQDLLPQKFISSVAARLPRLIVHKSDVVRSFATSLYCAWCSHEPEYKETCITFLHNDDEIVRQATLSSDFFFLTPGATHHLLHFRNDPSVTETGGMGGPWRYWLRDWALEIIETINGITFPRQECFSIGEEHREVYWYSWQPCLNWFKEHEKTYDHE